ncbi:MAG TPA: pilus assembly protein PilM [Phycisphaerae bacterium]|nr:pilus assembly protein PilM [Phycisphaerae bacterium]
MLIKSNDSLLAIDLATDAVRVLDVRMKRAEAQIEGFATQSVAAGTPETLPERHLEALGALIATNRFKSRKCVAAMPTSLITTRAVAIDPNKPQPADEQVRWTLQNCLPFDPRDLIFDYWPVGNSPANARTRDVLVVAMQGSVVKRYLAGLERQKLTCVHLDVAPCAVASLIARLAAASDAVVGAVTLTDTGGYFAIVERQRVLFWRPFEFPPIKPGASREAAMDRIGDEISKCVSHMVGSMQVDHMAELLTFGNGAEDSTFSDYLQDRFHMPVRSPSPFDGFSPEAMPLEVRSAVEPAVASHYAAAVGLAMQPAGV